MNSKKAKLLARQASDIAQRLVASGKFKANEGMVKHNVTGMIMNPQGGRKQIYKKLKQHYNERGNPEPKLATTSKQEYNKNKTRNTDNQPRITPEELQKASEKIRGTNKRLARTQRKLNAPPPIMSFSDPETVKKAHFKHYLSLVSQGKGMTPTMPKWMKREIAKRKKETQEKTA